MSSSCYKTVVAMLGLVVQLRPCECQKEGRSSFSCLSGIGARGGGWGDDPLISWLSRQEEHSILPLLRQ